MRDDAAVEFSSGFYQTLAAGKPYPACFRVGYSAIQTAKIPGYKKAILWSAGVRFDAGSERLDD